MNQNNLSFKSEKLVVDYICLNIRDSSDLKTIPRFLFSIGFNSSTYLNNIFQEKDSLQTFRNKFNVSFRHYTYNPKIKSFWEGTKVHFKGINATYFYQIVKQKIFDWNIFDLTTTDLARFDLYYTYNNDKTNDFTHTTESFYEFLVDSRRHILKHTNTRYAFLTPDGKALKINRRSNPLHFRVYEKDEKYKTKPVRFELEITKRQAQSLQDYFFNNQFETFEHKVTLQFYKCSLRFFPLYKDDKDAYPYTDWLVDFKRRYKEIFQRRSTEIQTTYPSLLTSYLENEINYHTTKVKDEEQRFFHLLQFLTFVKHLDIDPSRDFDTHLIENQLYYILKFPLSQFVKFTGIQISNKYQREKIVEYFKQLQKIDPIVKEFSDGAFRSYVVFPYADATNPSGRSWVVKIYVAQELFYFNYPFQFTKSFIASKSKNDLYLKVKLIQTLAVKQTQKIFDLEEFLFRVSLPNPYIIQLKKTIIQLLNELVDNQLIENNLEIITKKGTNRHISIKDLTFYNLNGQIKYLKFTENIKNHQIKYL